MENSVEDNYAEDNNSKEMEGDVYNDITHCSSQDDNEDEHNEDRLAGSSVVTESSDDEKKDSDSKQNVEVPLDEEHQKDDDDGDDELASSSAITKSNHDGQDNYSGYTLLTDLNDDIIQDDINNNSDSKQILEVKMLMNENNSVIDEEYQNDDNDIKDNKHEQHNSEFASSSVITKSNDDGPDNHREDTVLLNLNYDFIHDDRNKNIDFKQVHELKSKESEKNYLVEDEEYQEDDDDDDDDDDDKDEHNGGELASSSFTTKSSDDGQDNHSVDTFPSAITYDAFLDHKNKDIDFKQMHELTTLESEDEEQQNDDIEDAGDDDVDDDKDKRYGSEFASSCVITKSKYDGLDNHCGDTHLLDFNYEVLHDDKNKDIEVKQMHELKSKSDEEYQEDDNDDNDDKHSGGEIASPSIIKKSNDDGQDNHSRDIFPPAITYDAFYYHEKKYIDIKQRYEVTTLESEHQNDDIEEDDDDKYEHNGGEFASSCVITKSKDDGQDNHSEDTYLPDLKSNVLHDGISNNINSKQMLELNNSVIEDEKYQSDYDYDDNKGEHNGGEFNSFPIITKSNNDGPGNHNGDSFLSAVAYDAFHYDIKKELTTLENENEEHQNDDIDDDTDNGGDDDKDEHNVAELASFSFTKKSTDDEQDNYTGDTFPPAITFDAFLDHKKKDLDFKQMHELTTLESEDEEQQNDDIVEDDNDDYDKDEHNGDEFASSSVITKSKYDGQDNHSEDTHLPDLNFDVLQDGINKNRDSKQMLVIKPLETENSSVIEDEKYQHDDNDIDDSKDERYGGEFASSSVITKSNDDGVDNHSGDTHLLDFNYEVLHDDKNKDIDDKQMHELKYQESEYHCLIEDEEYQEDDNDDNTDKHSGGEIASPSVIKKSTDDGQNNHSADTFSPAITFDAFLDHKKKDLDFKQMHELTTLESEDEEHQNDDIVEDNDDDDDKDECYGDEFASSCVITKSNDDGQDIHNGDTYLTDLKCDVLHDGISKNINSKQMLELETDEPENNSVIKDEEYQSDYDDDDKDEHYGGEFDSSCAIAKSNDDGQDNHSEDTHLPDLNFDVLQDGINKNRNSKQMLEIITLDTEKNSVIGDEEYQSDDNDIDYSKDERYGGEFASSSVITKSNADGQDNHSRDTFPSAITYDAFYYHEKKDIDFKQRYEVTTQESEDEEQQNYDIDDEDDEDDDEDDDDDNDDHNKDEHYGGEYAGSSVISERNDDERNNHSGDTHLLDLTYDAFLNENIDFKEKFDVKSMETENNSVIKDEKNQNSDCSDDEDSCSETSEESDEHLEKLYSHPSYAEDYFQALERIKKLAFLTDLTLITRSGSTFHVHSLVLAAVSSLVLQLINERDEKKQKEMFLHLDPEASDVGISAVLEFAYSGTLTGLNRESLSQIQTAALLLKVPRILELCKEKERQKGNGDEKIKDDSGRIFDEKQLNLSLKSIRQLWEDRVGCDVEVEAEGRIYRAHKVILSASSDYFYAMFHSGMRESQESAVSLLIMGAHELEAILHFCYRGEMVLDWGCIFPLTSTTFRFQFKSAWSLCIRFMNEEMDAYRCLDVASFAEAYAMSDLQEMADDFVLRHFEDVASTLKFQDLTVEKLKKYLKSDCLCVASELPVFKAVKSWVEANPSKRAKDATELMGTILFSLMTFTEFNEVKVINSWPQVSASNLYESLLEDFCSSPCNNAQAKFRTYCPKETLVLVGGERMTENLDKRLPCREIWFSNSFHNHVGITKRIEWRMLGDLPEKPRFSHRVGAIKGKLYIVGGRHYYGKDDTMKSAYSYDPIQKTWQCLASMCKRRASFALVVSEEKMYAIGGERDSEVNIESVEMYCPIKDSWSLVHPLDQPLSDHAASVWKGEIFISGGFDQRYQCLATILLYHPQKGTTYLADMSQRRAQHCMETLQDYLYIAGGISVADGQYFDQLACEMYDPNNGFCCSIMALSVPHVRAASVVLEGKVYIIGGYCHKDFGDTKQVHRYDSKTRRWESLYGMPGPNTNIAACVLPIPLDLRN